MNIKTFISTTLFFTTIMFISIINVAHSTEKVIATVYNDGSNTSYKLIVADQDGRGIINAYKDVYESGKKVRRDLLNPDVITQSGMVLEQRDSHVIMKLVGNNFDLELGGMMVIDTLYNGVSGERRKYEVQLAQDKDGWKLFKNGSAINEIVIQTNKIRFIGAVGIKNLVMR